MYWMVIVYNELDAEFGYDCGAQVYMSGLDRATAKSIARNLNKRCPSFISYGIQEQPRRLV